MRRVTTACLLGLLAGLAPARAQAQSPAQGDQPVLYAALLKQAKAFLERSGETFYAVGAYVDTAGKQWGFTPEKWPALSAPAQEWEDSLAGGTQHLYPRARAVAWLVDIVSRDDTLASDTLGARFHYESADGACASVRRSYKWEDSGTITWGAEAVLPCARRTALRAGAPAR
jgi:hypothetical protein